MCDYFLPCVATEIFIPSLSSDSCGHNAHIFVLKGAVLAEIFANYNASRACHQNLPNFLFCLSTNIFIPCCSSHFCGYGTHNSVQNEAVLAELFTNYNTIKINCSCQKNHTYALGTHILSHFFSFSSLNINTFNLKCMGFKLFLFFLNVHTTYIKLEMCVQLVIQWLKKLPQCLQDTCITQC